MPYYKDLREYIWVLEASGQLIRFKKPINKDTELMPLVRLQFRGLPEEQRRAFVFESVVDSRGKEYRSPVVVGALAGSDKIFSLGMMCQVSEIADRLVQAEMHPLKPVMVDKGPVQEEVHLGDTLMEHGCLDEFPIPISTPGYDASPAITAPFWVTKDPDSGIRNVGTYRALVKSPTRTGCAIFRTTRGIAVHWNKYHLRGEPLPAALIIGGPPCIGYVSVTGYPQDSDELAIAGGIAGEPLELVKCKTVDLEVPAHAEIVIEGEVDTRQIEPEGPFGEAMGVMGLTEIRHFFNVKCITHRHNPLWLAYISQFPPSESSKIRYHGDCAAIYKHLKFDLNLEKVLKVALNEAASAVLMMVVQVKDASTKEVWSILDAAVEFIPSRRSKIIIAVDDDINPDDAEGIIFALANRYQPQRDTRIVTVPAEALSDYSLLPADVIEQMKVVKPASMPSKSIILIDATRKWAYPPQSLPKKEFMDRAQELWREAGLPELKLREPVWGRNFGYWSEEDERKAKRAVAGEYYVTGQEQAQQRIPA